MTRCQSVAEALALSAAGLLDPGEERMVREHIRECPECAARLEHLGAIAGTLSALPAPAPPAGLVARTQALAAAELAAAADRRHAGLAALAAAALGWLSWFVLWELYRMATGGWQSVVEPAWPGVWTWLAVSTAMACVAAPLAAALARARRREGRVA